MTDDGPARALRTRRAPPPFRRLEVVRIEDVTPRLTRVTLGGPELAGLVVEEPAASVRVLLPPPDGSELVIPEWQGNEYRLPDGSRPPIRTLTPRRVDLDALELDLEIVRHGGGAASTWAGAAVPGSPAAVSGPARGYTIDPSAAGFLLAGDETAIAAIGQLLESMPPDRPVRAVIEAAVPEARLDLPAPEGATVHWVIADDGATPGDALVADVVAAELAPGTKVWAAGEAAAMQRIRRRLFDERGMARADATVRGYWKHGRAGDAGDGG